MAASDWEAVIGMEVHVQLSTRSKMFCSCSADYLGAGPNTNTCPVCLGLPGALPVANQKAVELVVRTAVALGSTVATESKFDRKNYFYPDLPKGYQISQFDLPLARGGSIAVEGREVRITRVHLEEDTGKLAHAGDKLHQAAESWVDLNRSGLALMEIVSEPDLRSADEARAYAVELRSLLRSVGASEADMEKGQLRAEANVSVRPRGRTELGIKTELKNINSFRSLQRAIAYEVERQVACLERGEVVVQETRGWSEAEARTFSQRSKEEAQDYRYFPEPDLPPIALSPTWIEATRASLPELPADRKRRLARQYGLPEYDVQLLMEDGAQADLFEAAVALGAEPKPVANWVIGGANRVSASQLASLVKLVAKGAINRDQAQTLLEVLEAQGGDPEEVAAHLGLTQLDDEAELRGVIEAAIQSLPQAAADYRAGKQRAMGALLAEVKAKTDGRANMKLANRLLIQALGEAKR